MKAQIALFLLACASVTQVVIAADANPAYPTRPITLVVPFSAGGASTLIGRVVSEKMGRLLGQPFVVDNRTGAGGAVGMKYVASAKPDGCTLGIASVSTHVTAPACNSNLSYDPIKDFAPVTNLAKSPKIIAVNPAFPAKNYSEFLALLKANPDKYAFATAGVCTIGHLLGAQFQAASGTKFQHIAYRGGATALNDVIANQVPILMDNLPPVMPFIKSGAMRPIVISWPSKMADLPGVPTFADVGLAAINQPTWQGLVAPAGTLRPSWKS